jgi:hypothetical protein
MVFPLLSVKNLAKYIIGSSLEILELEDLISAFGKEIANRVLFGSELIDDVADDMHERFTRDGVMVTTLSVENIYKDSMQAVRNEEIFKEALEIAIARAKIGKVSTVFPYDMRLRVHLCICTLQVYGSRILDPFATGGAVPTVDIGKKPISEAQVKLFILPCYLSTHPHHIISDRTCCKADCNKECRSGTRWDVHPKTCQ